MNVEIGTEATQFPYWQYVHNQNFFAVCTYEMHAYFPSLPDFLLLTLSHIYHRDRFYCTLYYIKSSADRSVIASLFCSVRTGVFFLQSLELKIFHGVSYYFILGF